jgi:hypothetical protein
VSNDEINDLICDVLGLAFALDVGFDCFGFADEALFAATLGAAFFEVAFGFAFDVVFLGGTFFAILISPFCFIAVCLCKHYM